MVGDKSTQTLRECQIFYHSGNLLAEFGEGVNPLEDLVAVIKSVCQEIY